MCSGARAMQVACLRCHPARKPLRRFSTQRRFPPFLTCRTPVRSISDTHPVDIGHRSGPNRTPFRSHPKTVRHQPRRLSDFNRNTVRFESERCPTSNRIGVRFASEYASVVGNRTEAHEFAEILSSIVINETDSDRRVLIPLSRGAETGFQGDDQGVRCQ